MLRVWFRWRLRVWQARLEARRMAINAHAIYDHGPHDRRKCLNAEFCEAVVKCTYIMARLGVESSCVPTARLLEGGEDG